MRQSQGGVLCLSDFSLFILEFNGPGSVPILARRGVDEGFERAQTDH